MSKVILCPGGPRSALLITQAYAEERLPCPDIDERRTPVKLLYPRSYITATAAMPGEKMHDYCFMGGLYRADTFPHRAWILDFARRHFTGSSYFLITDGRDKHHRLGAFDYTNLDRDVFVPKEVPPPERGFFHPHFFQVLRASKFTLCPAGDAPWSMRFFEAVMCRSIPIVSDRKHMARNRLEQAIGYHAFLATDPHVYDPVIAEENYRKFIQHQTLIGNSPVARISPDGRTTPSPSLPQDSPVSHPEHRAAG